MSIIEEIWNGNSCREELPIDFGPEVGRDKAMSVDYILNNNMYYRCNMRWNKNNNEKRFAVCWVCGKETNDYHSHAWRTQDGRIRNIKCSSCYDDYSEMLKIKSEEKRGRGSLNFRNEK